MGVHGKMREHIEKFGVLPFSMGCVSHASVDVAEQRPRRPKLGQSPTRNKSEEDDEESLSGESTKQLSSFLAFPRPNLSTGVNRLVKGFKSLSQLFIYEDEMEELGMDMEIGGPTDVKHVTHIGWDSLANTNPFLGWDDNMDIHTTPASLITHPTPDCAATFKQFSLASAPENHPPSFISLDAASTR